MTLHLISLSQSTGKCSVVNLDTGKAIATFEPEANGGGALYKAQDYCKQNGLQTIN